MNDSTSPYTPQPHLTPVEGPPPRTSATKDSLKDNVQQGLEYVRFVWRMSSRIRSWDNRLRFVIGLILWKPVLPRDNQN